MPIEVDRNFDGLAKRFRRNVYGSLKGRVRLNVLERDFNEFIPHYKSNSHGKRVLDMAAGEARFSASLAAHGCDLVVNDVSTEMLALAHATIESCASEQGENEEAYKGRVKVIQCPFQQLEATLRAEGQNTTFDLILCHALIEWMAQPETLIPSIPKMLKPGGYLSLTFYNINGLAFKNLLRTNFHKFDIDNFTPFKGSLTPTRPQDPAEVKAQLEQHGFTIVCKSGIRVFHDYILDPQERNRDPDALIAKELAYSRREPFWQMARYIHFLCRYE